jgi:hypothetical protein
MPNRVPVDVTGGENIVSAALSHRGTLALTASGRVLFSGEGAVDGAELQPAKQQVVSDDASFVDTTKDIQRVMQTLTVRATSIMGGRCSLVILAE